MVRYYNWIMSYVATCSCYSGKVCRFNEIHINFGYTYDSYFSKWI